MHIEVGDDFISGAEKFAYVAWCFAVGGSYSQGPLTDEVCIRVGLLLRRGDTHTANQCE
jgi:hypothetical protein